MKLDKKDTVLVFRKRKGNSNITREFRNHLVNIHRIEFDEREKEGVLYLQHAEHNYGNRLEMIKALVLCMDKDHSNYCNLGESGKDMVDTLIACESAVNTTISTLFQWFGTIVGSADIGDLLDTIRDNSNYKKVNLTTKEVKDCETP